MQHLERLKLGLSEKIRKVVIIPHQKPDADALGSCLALAGFLKRHQHHVQVISPTDYPGFLNWMEGNSEVLIYNDKRKAQIEEGIQQADYIFCLDFSDLKRIEPLDAAVKASQAQIVLVDHHEGKQDFAHLELWRTSAAATAELIYELLNYLGGKGNISLAEASCIYAGIVTDTGSFKFPATSSAIHRIAADLLDIGIDHSDIHRRIYDTSSEDRLRLLAYALGQKLVVLKDAKVAYFVLSNDELMRFNYRTGDTEGIVNYALSIEGIRLAALFTENGDNDGVKISFRSVGAFSVNDFARANFNGGGHRNAAGGKVQMSLPEAEKYFLSLLPSYHSQLSVV